MTDNPVILLKTTRNNIADNCYWGSCYLAFDGKIIASRGLSEKSIVYMRSAAKPLQSSIVCDCNIIKDLKLTSRELAIFCGSHSGSEKHIKLLKETLKKHNIKISDFELLPQAPLDTRHFNNRKTKLHNNCSGKHLMMILTSKYLNFDIKNYTNENHPVQKLIYNKQTELSHYKSTYLTFDGCSAPLWGLPVQNMITAYFNLFKEEKYKPLIKSILKNPYIFGGYDRLDTQIIQYSKSKLFSKTGAGGFVLVYNTQNNGLLLLKMAQNNNEARKLILFHILNKLNWLNTQIKDYELNQKGQKVAKYCYELDF